MKDLIGRLFGNKKEIIDITHNLKLVSECEMHVSDFYRHVADVRKNEREFWLKLAEAEVGHAENISKMVALMESHPKMFKKGVEFSPGAIRTFSLYMDGVMERLHKGKLSDDELLDTAAHIENSAFEMDYAKMVLSEDKDFNALAARIHNETGFHKEAVLNKISELKQDI